nr:tetratricopeptide repeat protein [Leucobacter edaphi]
MHPAPEHGVASESWDERIDQFWERADDADPAGTLDALRPLVAERGPNDPDGVYEWASVHDFLGREEEAIPLYEAALAAGLAGARRPQAVIQLASSLRNVGRAAEAAALLCGLEESPDRDAAVGDAHRAFLALALRDMGQPDEALRLALLALAPTLPRYRRSVAAYAESLAARPENGE